VRDKAPERGLRLGLGQMIADPACRVESRAFHPRRQVGLGQPDALRARADARAGDPIDGRIGIRVGWAESVALRVVTATGLHERNERGVERGLTGANLLQRDPVAVEYRTCGSDAQAGG